MSKIKVFFVPKKSKPIHISKKDDPIFGFNKHSKIISVHLGQLKVEISEEQFKKLVMFYVRSRALS